MIVLNFVPVKTGGGLQNALSFLKLLHKEQPPQIDYLITCTKGGPIESFCINKNLNHKAISKGFLGRVLYELIFGFFIAKKNNAKIIFSLFGGAPIISPGIYKISGFAYSNIIQKEVPFWSFLSGPKKILKKSIDILRYYLACQADEVIVETDYLAERARTGVFKGKIIHVVKMAPSTIVLSSLASKKNKSKHSSHKTIDILYLSGAHPNKRIHLLANVFSELNKSEFRYRLITTLPENTPYTKIVKESFDSTKTKYALKNIGPTPPEKVGELLSRVDGMANTALLESFSNNWVEAWATEIPLIATDASWARHSCGDAAIYIDLANPEDSAKRICAVFESPESLREITNKGKEHLKSLPSPEERFSSYIKLINSALLKVE